MLGGQIQSQEDLMSAVVRDRMSAERIDVPAGLAGVVVAETELGDVRGLEGFYHYRQYSAVELARTRSVEDGLAAVARRRAT